MALTKDQKQAQVKDLTEKMSSASSIMLAHYIGLSVGEVSELRSKLREGEAEMKVAKKTLMKIAAKEAGIPEFEENSMEGPVSLIFSFGDPLSGAQAAFKFGKDHEQVQLLGGLFDGKILSKEKTMELAQMPSRDALLAIFASMIRSPLVSFASICGSPLSGFTRAMQELAEKGGVNPPNQSSDDDGSEQAEEDPKPSTDDDGSGQEKPAEEAPADAEPSETEEKPNTPEEETEPEKTDS